MSVVARYPNLKGKVTAVTAIPAQPAGPYSVAGAAVWYFAGVPCAGARQVVFTVRGVGAGALASQTCLPGNHEDGSDAANASSGDVTLRGDGGFSISVGGGLRVAVVPTAGLHHHRFLFFSITNDATAKTSVSVDAEVWYDDEAYVAKTAFGQDGVVPATY